MSKSLRVELITPLRERYTGDADYVEAPGGSGILGILPNHANLLSTLESGELKVCDPHKTHYFAIGSGFLQVRGNNVLILVSQAFKPDEINISAATSECKRLEEELADTKDTNARTRINAALRLANTQVVIAKREQYTE